MSEASLAILLRTASVRYDNCYVGDQDHFVDYYYFRSLFFLLASRFLRQSRGF